jgi:hypothetical protein
VPDVTLEVTAKLDQIEQALSKISNLGDETKRLFEEMSKSFTKTTVDQTNKVQQQAQKTGQFFKRVLESMRSDMKTLANIESIKGGLKLTSMFEGSVKEAMTLGDTIRRLGATFGMAKEQFAGFQTKMMKGMADIGMSSDVAARALEGLAETPVRGEENLLKYVQTAGQLAKLGGETGQEGVIAKGMAGVIQAKGGKVNDPRQMMEVADALRRVQIATGKKATESLRTMSDIFTHMSSDMRRKMGPKQMAMLAAGGMAAGPGATGFIESYMQKSGMQRAFQTATGGGKLFDEKGFNTEAIKKFYEEAKQLGQGDIRIGLKAMGIASDEDAEGFQRLAEHLDEVADAQKKATEATVDLEKAHRDAMGTSEAFKANIDKLKGTFASPLSKAQGAVTDVLSKASETKTGSALVVGASALAASLLTGHGVKGLMKTGIGFAKEEAEIKARETITGEKIQHVWVDNADEIGGGDDSPVGKIGDLASKGAKILSGGPVAMVSSVVSAASGVGTAVILKLILDQMKEEGPKVQDSFDKANEHLTNIEQAQLGKKGTHPPMHKPAQPPARGSEQ